MMIQRISRRFQGEYELETWNDWEQNFRLQIEFGRKMERWMYLQQDCFRSGVVALIPQQLPHR